MRDEDAGRETSRRPRRAEGPADPSTARNAPVIRERRRNPTEVARRSQASQTVAPRAPSRANSPDREELRARGADDPRARGENSEAKKECVCYTRAPLSSLRVSASAAARLRLLRLRPRVPVHLAERGERGSPQALPEERPRRGAPR